MNEKVKIRTKKTTKTTKTKKNNDNVSLFTFGQLG